jgi:hypothetical protein
MKRENASMAFYPSSFNLHPFGLPGFPWRVRFQPSDGNPGTNGVITKLAAERGIKSIFPVLQAATSEGSRETFEAFFTPLCFEISTDVR